MEFVLWFFCVVRGIGGGVCIRAYCPCATRVWEVCVGEYIKRVRSWRAFVCGCVCFCGSDFMVDFVPPGPHGEKRQWIDDYDDDMSRGPTDQERKHQLTSCPLRRRLRNLRSCDGLLRMKQFQKQFEAIRILISEITNFF